MSHGIVLPELILPFRLQDPQTYVGKQTRLTARQQQYEENNSYDKGTPAPQSEEKG
jgi:hypothetical protein